MDGSYTLHAQGPGPYNPNPVGAFVRFILDAPVPFSSISGLDAIFTATAGGNALGSPRFSLITDAPTQYKNIVILEGPLFTGDDAQLNAFSGVNLIGNQDVGRYDLSHVGGSGYTNYAGALAFAGGLNVSEIDFVQDPGYGQTLILDRIDASTPEPASVVLLASLVGFVGFATRKLRQKQTA